MTKKEESIIRTYCGKCGKIMVVNQMFIHDDESSELFLDCGHSKLINEVKGGD